MGKYLVCADGSPPAYEALDMVYQLYNKDNDSVVILTVAGVEEHFWQDAATKEEQKRRQRKLGIKFSLILPPKLMKWDLQMLKEYLKLDARVTLFYTLLKLMVLMLLQWELAV